MSAAPRTLARAGVIEAAVLKLFSRRTSVCAVEAVTDRFRLVTIAGEDLVSRDWTPGDMVQIAFAGWESRAYTPLSFDARAGTTEFLGYLHGNGIGSAWLASPTIGEPCLIVGPRAALDLNAVRRPAVFFGDETSFSTVAAMRATALGMLDVAVVLEVSSIEHARVVLDRIGVTGNVTLFPREDGDHHLETLEAEMLSAFRRVPDAHAVLTGKASSIQRLYKGLRKAGIPGKQTTNIAYWAPGRKGFSGVQR